MKLIEADHPFFRPLWVRVLIVLVCACWGAFELYTGQIFWALLFWAFAAMSVHAFFIAPRGNG